MYTVRYILNACKAGQRRSLAFLLFVTLMSQAALGQTNIFIDFGGTEGNGAGASPSPWVTIDSLIQDEPVDLADGITLTPLDDGFTANNPAPPNEDAEYDDIIVPQEARNDYLYKNVDAAGTEARMRIDGLPAGTYRITVFEGRTSDASQFAKIWTGEEPASENTGDFAGQSASVLVTVTAGEPLYYKHLEDNSGGVSGMLIRQQSAPKFSSLQIDFGGTEGNGAGASPSPWVTIDILSQDQTVDLGAGISLTALDDGFTANNPAPPNEEAEYDGFVVPQEARNDYFYKNVDAAGTEARMRIDGLPAGVYNITVFEGRTTDAGQVAKIWGAGDTEPESENTGGFAGGGATVAVTLGAGDSLWYKHLEDNSGGVSGMIIRRVSAAVEAPFQVDFGGTEGNGAGASPVPWISIDILNQDEVVDLGRGVTLTALDDGFTANNPAPPAEPAVYDGILVPAEARDDYFYKNVDAAGTEARMRIDGLAAGTYNVTVFEGRTTDAGQVAKIWSGGEEPSDENTGTFAGGSATVEVVIADGAALWYKHLEDNSGGISGMIIRQTDADESQAFLAGAFGSAGGFSALISGAAGVDVASVSALLNGQVIDVTAEKDGDAIRITYTVDGSPLPAESIHDLEVSWDQGGSTQSQATTFSVGLYSLVSADVALSDADTSTAGFLMRVVQSEEGLPNNTSAREQHLRGEIGGENVADDWQSDNYIWTVDLINMDQNEGSAGEFYDRADGSTRDVFDEFIPGIPGVTDSTDNFTAEIKTVVKIPSAGLYTFGFNSDDGFRTSVGNDAADSLIVGEYNGGRGAATTTFDVYFQEPGNYAMRTIYYEGGGGANLEWFTNEPAKALLNDRDNGGLETFAYESSFAARVTSVEPGGGARGVDPESSISVRIEDESGSVDQGSVSLMLDGVDAGAQITKQNGVTSVTIDRSGQLWQPSQVVTASLQYTVDGETRDVSWSWTVGDYLILPTVGYRTDLGSGEDRGFTMRVHQLAGIRANSTPEVEAQLRGERGDNLADPLGGVESSDPNRPGVIFDVDGVINFDQDGAAQGVFRDLGDGSLIDRSDDYIPGIPGLEEGTDNIGAEILSYIEFPESGFYRMIFNSDDGFRVTLGHEASSDAMQLGVFSGGRGAADTVFGFAVVKPGLYPMRAIWYEGGGGANLEWSTTNLSTRVLINDPEGGLKAYRARTGDVDTEEETSGAISSIELSDGSVVIAFEGILKSSSAVGGPYEAVAGATSPYSVAPEGESHFFIAE